MGEQKSRGAEAQRRKGTEGKSPLPPRSPAPLLPCVIAGGLFLATLALYLSTLAPSVATLFDDSLEFQLVTYQLGIAHPTGYPLYTILGKLFTLLPIGDVAYRVNLMSAVFGAATVALVYLLILRVAAPGIRDGYETVDGGGGAGGFRQPLHSLRPSFTQTGPGEAPPAWPGHVGGLLGALLLAVSPVFWQQATIAEVYTLNSFFVAALLLSTATLPSAEPKKQRPGLCWLAFLSGLSLTHHRTILLLLPAVALYLLLSLRRLLFQRQTLILSAGLALAPLLLYLYLPLRGHIGSLDGVYQNTWAGFWRQVSAGGYGLFIFSNPFGHERNLAFYWDLLERQFYTTIPGLIGLIYLLWMGRGRILALTGVAFLTYTGFNLFYNVSDIEVFFIPVFLLWAVWSGSGAAGLLYLAASLKMTTADRRPFGFAQDRPPTANIFSPNLWQAGLTGLILAIFIFIIFQHFQVNRLAIKAGYTWQVHDYGLDILQQPLPPEEKPVIVGILGEMTLLRYFQQTEQRRPDLETVAADVEADRLAVVEKLLAEEKSVYLTRELAGAAARWSLKAVGPLIRVDPEPVSKPPEFSVQVNQAVIPEIELLGYNLSRPPHTGPGPAPLRLTLFWQPTASIQANLKVSARLLTLAGEPLVAVDAVPVHFAYPTTAWRPGEIVSDVYDLILPVGTPPGQYTPLLIWYDPAQNAAEVGRIELQPVMIE